jgi:hypothetical protein
MKNIAYAEIKHLAHRKAWGRFNNALRVFCLLRYKETSAHIRHIGFNKISGHFGR